MLVSFAPPLKHHSCLSSPVDVITVFQKKNHILLSVYTIRQFIRQSPPLLLGRTEIREKEKLLVVFTILYFYRLVISRNGLLTVLLSTIYKIDLKSCITVKSYTAGLALNAQCISIHNSILFT